MNQQRWEIEKYVTETGVCPFDEWFDTLDVATQARIDVRLDRVSLDNFGDYRSSITLGRRQIETTRKNHLQQRIYQFI